MIEAGEYTHFLIQTIYLVILAYFVLGGLGFYLINRNKPREQARKSYLKFLVYFIIINLLFWCIVLFPEYFQYLAFFIAGAGLLELIYVFLRSEYPDKKFFICSLVVYIAVGYGFYRFSFLPYQVLLYVFLTVSIFDSFSQITGQLWGKQKIVPTISPNKTLGGVLGGFLVATGSAFLLSGLYPDLDFGSRLWFIFGILLFAFAGDILASLYKRKFSIKDYNQLIPGHGGFLDRFDSLIAAGAWCMIFFRIQPIISNLFN